MAKTPNIPVARPQLSPRERELVLDCVDSAWISSLGRHILEFERSFAQFCGARYGVATSNGTTALHLVLAALGVGPGDEVLVPALTFVATAAAVAYTGARPVFLDSESATYNLDPALIERAVTPRTKGIIAVHIYGHPANMAPILEAAGRRGLWVVEDAAEAHGARVNLTSQGWQRVGSLAKAACFSFYGNKIITTGEGGMVLTDDQELVARLRLLRDHGMDPQRPYWHPVVGYNYRMTNLQAALGVAQVERIEAILAHKAAIAEQYNDRLAEVPGLRRPPAEPWARPVNWLYSLLVEPGFPLSRDDLRLFLLSQGVDSRPFFTPLHLLPPYHSGQSLPVAEDLSQRGISLPSGPAITPAEIDQVCQALAQAAEAAA
ncbi:MAG: DegT/DnrJ/EryC1/StrS family aminotransferase [Desulfarculus sp.]|nr:MAG: DegT/DnrJ/EryC1/StrS family aminotransferase [Desulfarculus sp.]